VGSIVWLLSAGKPSLGVVNFGVQDEFARVGRVLVHFIQDLPLLVDPLRALRFFHLYLEDRILSPRAPRVALFGRIESAVHRTELISPEDRNGARIDRQHWHPWLLLPPPPEIAQSLYCPCLLGCLLLNDWLLS
jgi:hypothetical protein